MANQFRSVGDARARQIRLARSGVFELRRWQVCGSRVRPMRLPFLLVDEDRDEFFVEDNAAELRSSVVSGMRRMSFASSAFFSADRARLHGIANLEFIRYRGANHPAFPGVDSPVARACKGERLQ